jgi:uncharacterized protein DUF5670
MIAPSAGPSFPSETLVNTAAILVWVWLVGIAGFYDAGPMVHLLFVAAIALLIAGFSRRPF